jgi:hypothetical protein
MRFCDEIGFAFGWLVDGFLQRSSHALVVDGGVWLVDPMEAEGVEERVRAAGVPAGVIQLLDRHERSCSALARRLEVPHHVVPRAPIVGAPFEFLSIADSRFWNEVALWWPDRRALVCGDVLGTTRYFRAGGELIGVHPLLRLFPPRRRLGGLDPLHVLCGHGEGVHGATAAPAVREALATARRRLPRAWLQAGLAFRRGSAG